MRFTKTATDKTKVCLHGLTLGLADAIPAMVLEAHHSVVLGDPLNVACGNVVTVRRGREWTVSFDNVGSPFKIVRGKALWSVEHAGMTGMDTTLAGALWVVLGLRP